MTIYIDFDEKKLIDKETYEKELHKKALFEAEYETFWENYLWEKYGKFSETVPEDIEPTEEEEYLEYLKEEIEAEPDEYWFEYGKFEIDG